MIMGNQECDDCYPHQEHTEALALSTLHVLLATSSGTVRHPVSAMPGTGLPWSRQIPSLPS